MQQFVRHHEHDSYAYGAGACAAWQIIEQRHLADNATALDDVDHDMVGRPADFDFDGPFFDDICLLADIAFLEQALTRAKDNAGKLCLGL